MATREQLEAGLIAADKAGNVEDARVFANAIRAMGVDAASLSVAAKNSVGVRAGKTQESTRPEPPIMRDPRTGLPMVRDFEGIGKRLDVTKGMTLQGGLATAGGIAGSPLGPLGVAGGAFLGGAIGNALHQETSPGYDVSKPGLGLKKGEILASGLVSAIPGGSAASGGIRALAKEALKQGGGGVLAKNIETGIDEGRLATTRENLFAGGIPAVGGAVAQKIQSLSPEAQAALNAAKPVEQQSYDAGRKIGLVTTNEAGKPPAVMANLASTKNRPKINEAAAVDLGLPADAEITLSALDRIRTESGKPYSEIETMASEAAKKASDIRKQRFTATDPHELQIQMNDPKTVADLAPLDIQAGADINGLRKARDAAKDGFRAYKISGDPRALEAAENALETAGKLEAQIEAAALSAGKPELLKDLASARQRIAKTYDVERALNTSTGDVSAPILGRQLDNGKPLSGNLKAIADFNNAFPFATREGATVMAPGVTRAEGMTTILSALTGLGAGNAAGKPLLGLAAGLLPLTGPLKRQILLSEPYLRAFPKYAKPGVEQVIQGARWQDALPLSPQGLSLREISQAAGQRASDN